MTGQLQALSYPNAQVDLWAAVEGGIRQLKQRPSLPRRLWPIGAIVLAWRASNCSWIFRSLCSTRSCRSRPWS